MLLLAMFHGCCSSLIHIPMCPAQVEVESMSTRLNKSSRRKEMKKTKKEICKIQQDKGASKQPERKKIRNGGD